MAVAVVSASDSTPGLGTSLCLRCGPKKKVPPSLSKSVLLHHLLGFPPPCVISITYFKGNLYWPVKVSPSDAGNC